jgi:hypothetical protein
VQFLIALNYDLYLREKVDIFRLSPNQLDCKYKRRLTVLKKGILFGSFCTLALASPAFAAGLSGTLSADYLNFDFKDLGINVNAWGGAGELQGAVGSDMHVQGDITYHRLSGNGVSFDDSVLNGAYYWSFDAGRAGADLGYQTLKVDHAIAHEVIYGVFGEYWADDMFTLGLKGGGISDTNGGGSAYYIGGEAKAYVMPDLALAGTIGRTGAQGETDYSASAEWLVSETTPISISGSYTYADIGSGGGKANVWGAKVTYYFGDSSANTLADHQRSGNLGWACGASTVGVLL